MSADRSASARMRTRKRKRSRRGRPASPNSANAKTSSSSSAGSACCSACSTSTRARRRPRRRSWRAPTSPISRPASPRSAPTRHVREQFPAGRRQFELCRPVERVQTPGLGLLARRQSEAVQRHRKARLPSRLDRGRGCRSLLDAMTAMSTIELVDPELRDALAQWPLLPLTAESLTRRRANALELLGGVPKPHLPDIATNEIHVESAFGAKPIRVLTYRPVTSDDPLPVIVHIHGGGFVMGAPEMKDV